MSSASYYKEMAREAEAAKAAISSVWGKNHVKPAMVDIATPATTLKDAMTSLATDMMLLKGITVLRITSRGVWKARVVTLSSDKLAFFVTHKEVPTDLQSQLASVLPIPLWTPSKGWRWSNDAERYIRHIDIADVDAWQVGVIGTQLLEYAQHSIKETQLKEIVTVFHHGYQPTSFRVPNEHHLKALVHALEQMKTRYDLMVPWIANEQLLLRYIYHDVDVDKNGTISSKEFGDVCKRINFELRDRDRIFAEYAKNSTGCKNSNEITNVETRQLLHSFSVRDMPASKVWDRLFGENTSEIGPGRLRDDFLLQTQGEMNTSMEDAKLLVQSLKTMGYSINPKSITKAEFLQYLHSKYNDAYDPSSILPSTCKLDKPLSSFWINTSHNTYLMGDQLQSRSSVEAYVKALYRGCKCLELDCWDGEEDKNLKRFVPVVYHGHTLTSKIRFRSICMVVNNYLDDNPTSYPIILSLENHCSHPYQMTMADDMKEIFGKKLFIPGKHHTTGGELPSPEDLQGMVVVKGKRPPDPDEEDNDDDNKKKEGTNLRSATSSGDSIDDFDEALEASAKKQEKSKIVRELACLTLFHGTKYKDFNASIEQHPSHMHSIGETKITKILNKSKDNGRLWRKYNVRHITRTYPAGARVDSSNYNPVVPWAMGCQLVALNFQTSDIPLILNDGLFRQNGGCGYVMKPASVMGGSSPSKKSVNVLILSAHCLPKPRGANAGEVVDPYIQVELHDVRVNAEGKEEYASKTFKTTCVDNNGFCPVWKDVNVRFEIHNPDVAMLMFKIIDEDIGIDEIIAASAIPIACLRKGYRSVQLYDENDSRTGPFQSATLLVRIEY